MPSLTSGFVVRPRSTPIRIRSPTPFWSSVRSEEHTSELQSRLHLVCRLLLEKKKKLERDDQAGSSNQHILLLLVFGSVAPFGFLPELCLHVLHKVVLLVTLRRLGRHAAPPPS